MTYFALDVLLLGIKVVNMRANIVGRSFFLTASGALNYLEPFAFVRALSKLALLLPLSAARAQSSTIADIAGAHFVSAAIFTADAL